MSRSWVGVLLLAVLASGLALWFVWPNRPPSGSNDARASHPEPRSGSGVKAGWLEARERRVAETAWAKEILAQECGRTLEALWDSLNAATNKLRVAAEFPVGEVVWGRWEPPQPWPHGLLVRAPIGPGSVRSAAEWRGFVLGREREGWRLAQTELRHNRFETDAAGQPRQSLFYFSAHLTNVARPERAILVGDVIVDWRNAPVGDKPAAVQRIDISRLTLKTRTGAPPFVPVLEEEVVPPVRLFSIDPLLVYDLDGDGTAEILLPTVNLAYRRTGDGRYRSEPLCRFPPGTIFTALVADFDNDGTADLLSARADALVLHRGSPPSGALDQPERVVWRPSPPLQNPMALTCGDMDQDGDLDVFLGQYRVPTLGQVLRPFYYDANDGYPAYLLCNEGEQGFRDVTAGAGLEAKRRRRTYSASFADLDDDGRLDLGIVSDFAGLELYRNDGRGRFAEVTREWVSESRGFGMAHAFADFNADGRLDLLMIGMPSPTVDRLEHLGLTRPGSTEDWGMRRRMAYGNRLYLARPGGGFEQTPLNDSIARSGWSWGCSATDFDNDGFPDVYIANGHDTQRWVREYEPEFWLHDLYVDETVDDRTATAYFMGKFARTRGQGWSYGGYEKNRLYLNHRGESFLEIGHLMGVALEEDSRNVVTEDLDGDGRRDLIVTTYERWPVVRQTLRVYRNTLEDVGHWIGFRFPARGAGGSPVGVQVRVTSQGRDAVRQHVTGDSHRSQHASTLHFGLGAADHVERVEVRWADGRVWKLGELAIDRYHDLPPPAARPVPAPQ